MANLQLAQNQPTLIATFDHVSTLYIKQYGSGNLRIASRREDLQQDVNPSPGQIQDGIAQATADGFKQYFWEGDIWVISDVAGPIVYIVPNYTFEISRLNQGNNAPSPTGRASRKVQKDGLASY